MCDMSGTCMNLFRKFSGKLRIAAEGATREFPVTKVARAFSCFGNRHCSALGVNWLSALSTKLVLKVQSRPLQLCSSHSTHRLC